MRKYQDMAPCERIHYYRGEIRRMTPPRSERESLLIETFRYLISENEVLCDQNGKTELQKAGVRKTYFTIQ